MKALLLGMMSVLAASGEPGRATEWRLQRAVERAHSGTVKCVLFSPDGKSLVTAGLDGQAKYWDAATAELTDSAEFAMPIRWISFSRDGKMLAAALGEIGPGETATGALAFASPKGGTRLRGHEGPVYCTDFSPDARSLASAGFDRTVRLWDVDDGKERATLRGHTALVHSVRFSPDGKLIASCSFDGTARLWDASVGKELATLSGHSDAVRAVAFSPDGKTLATASEDMTVKIWRVASRQNTATLKGHTGWVLSVAFSPNGRLLATGGGQRDQSVKIWDVRTAREVTSIPRQRYVRTSVAFAPGRDNMLAIAVGHGFQLWEDVATNRPTRNERGAANEEHPQSPALRDRLR